MSGPHALKLKEYNLWETLVRGKIVGRIEGEFDEALVCSHIHPSFKGSPIACTNASINVLCPSVRTGVAVFVLVSLCLYWCRCVRIGVAVFVLVSLCSYWCRCVRTAQGQLSTLILSLSLLRPTSTLLITAGKRPRIEIRERASRGFFGGKLFRCVRPAPGTPLAVQGTTRCRC